MRNLPVFLQITFSGRINRYRYFGYQIGSVAFLFASLFTILAIIEHAILSVKIGTLSRFIFFPYRNLAYNSSIIV